MSANPLQESSESTSFKAHDEVLPQGLPLGHLGLYILTDMVGLYPPPPTNITSDELAVSAMTSGPPSSSSPYCFTCLLSGFLDEFLPYIGQEQSQWLIDISHDICDPKKKRGTLQVWDVSGGLWRAVNPADPPIASRYLYSSWGAVSLTKISQRTGKSKTTASGNASTMADYVKERDGQQCWVTRFEDPNTNSHIFPKRMGDHLLRVVYSTFVSTPPPGLSIYDGICGITLIRNLDTYFDTYEFGLRFVAPDVYACHSFRHSHNMSQGSRHTIYGIGHGADAPLLHGYRVSPPQPQHTHNPPPGLLRWHYLQCVIRKFAHSDYKNLQNIYYHELPLRMEGDSEDEGTDSECEWPSAVLDHGRAMQMAIKHHEARKRVVAEWVSGV